jgi:hypothetical protein
MAKGMASLPWHLVSGVECDKMAAILANAPKNVTGTAGIVCSLAAVVSTTS